MRMWYFNWRDSKKYLAFGFYKISQRLKPVFLPRFTITSSQYSRKYWLRSSKLKLEKNSIETLRASARGELQIFGTLFFTWLFFVRNQ